MTSPAPRARRPSRPGRRSATCGRRGAAGLPPALRRRSARCGSGTVAAPARDSRSDVLGEQPHGARAERAEPRRRIGHAACPSSVDRHAASSRCVMRTTPERSVAHARRSASPSTTSARRASIGAAAARCLRRDAGRRRRAARRRRSRAARHSEGRRASRCRCPGARETAASARRAARAATACRRSTRRRRRGYRGRAATPAPRRRPRRGSAASLCAGMTGQHARHGRGAPAAAGAHCRCAAGGCAGRISRRADHTTIAATQARSRSEMQHREDQRGQRGNAARRPRRRRRAARAPARHQTGRAERNRPPRTADGGRSERGARMLARSRPPSAPGAPSSPAGDTESPATRRGCLATRSMRP